MEAAGYEVKAEAAAVAAGAQSASLELELTAEDVERERAQRQTLTQALVAIGASLVFMVLMFTPQTTVAMEDINKLILVPATFIQFWAGGRFYRAAWRAGPARRRDDGHPRRGRHERRVGLLGLRDDVARDHPRGGDAPGDLLRLRRRSSSA